MTAPYKGNEINRFEYEKIKVMNNRFVVSNFIGLGLFLGGYFRGAPLPWLAAVFVMLCWFNLYLIGRFKKENSFPSVVLYKCGIEFFLGSIHKTFWYRWEDISKVRLVSPFERKTKGMLKFLEGRPGFELTFNDNRKVMVYQRIEGYAEFYKHLVKLGINGCEDKLPMYNRLNMYGQSIDGVMSSVNNYGEPKKYIDIK